MELGKFDFGQAFKTELGGGGFAETIASFAKPTLLAAAGSSFKAGADYPLNLGQQFKSSLPSYLQSVAPQGKPLQLESGYNTQPRKPYDEKARDVALSALKPAFAQRPQSAAFLENYLRGTGAPMEVSKANVDSYFKKPGFLDERAFGLGKKSNADQIRESVNSNLASNGNKPNSTFKMTGVTDWLTRGNLPTSADNAADIQTSLGKYAAKAVYEATYTTDSKGKISSIKVSYAPAIYDLYDFKASGQLAVQGDKKLLDQVPKEYQDVLVGNGTRVTDDYFARLSETGVAKPFYSWGVGSVKTETIKP